MRERRDRGSSMPLKVKVEEPAVSWKSIDERDDLRERGERGDAGCGEVGCGEGCGDDG